MQDMNRIIGEMWTTLPRLEKEPYAQQAREDKER